ncbi:cell division protein FtsZ [Candidatus Cloacimonadota bacterium]
MLELDLGRDEITYGTNIKIIGVGGAGGNAINTMIENNLTGVEFIAANTDISDLKKSRAKLKLQLGKEKTGGLGAGADPEVGKLSAEESREEVKKHLKGAHMIFIAAGMGGGTGTGAAPVIAALAKEMDILTIGIVSRPFSYEGKKRMTNAEKGIEKLRGILDTLIIFPNDKLNELYSDMTVIDAFKQADNILYEAAKAVSDIIHSSGFIKADFADVKTIMSNKGLALMGSATEEGDERARKAANAAMKNPLLSDIILEDCPGILINITVGKDFKMEEFGIITKEIGNKAGENADIIQGIINDPGMQGKVKVTIIATGLSSHSDRAFKPQIIETIQDDKKEELTEMFSRIRSSESNDLRKGSKKGKDYSGNLQMDIPAFMRKFSN